MKRRIRFLPVLLGLSFLFNSTMLYASEKVEIAAENKAFLKKVSKYSFKFFKEEVNYENGLVKDKASNFHKDNTKISSVAATGFALTAYPIGAERGWMDKEKAKELVKTTLLYFRDEMEHKEGFFYHFVNIDTGAREWKSEISSIDTALFIAGALFCGEYYGGEIKEIAEDIYKRVNWPWMLAGGTTLSMGWKPESGFIHYRWNQYAENLILYLLAIGSPTYPLDPSVWDLINRPVSTYEGFTSLVSPQLFRHQYSHIWVDFRNKHDKYVDYYLSSVNATLANREFCKNNAGKYEGFGENVWGLTACESPGGYDAYGSPPGKFHCDGTVAPTAPGGSMPFAPKECSDALLYMYKKYKDKVWGKYGFIDSFNIGYNWFCENVIAIDQGAIMLMIENYNSDAVWKHFMKNQYILSAMDAVGFVEGTKEMEIGEVPAVNASYGDFEVPLSEQSFDGANSLNADNHLEYGDFPESADDFLAHYFVRFTDDKLIFRVKVYDNEVIGGEPKETIYKKDLVELYFAPDSKILEWGSRGHFQLGFAPLAEGNKPAKYAWFQNTDIKEIEYQSIIVSDGYVMEMAIPFYILNIKIEKTDSINFSIAVHDADVKDSSVDTKCNLYFMPFYKKDAQQGFELAEISLQKQ